MIKMKKIIAVCGPTAVGKTEYAIRIAKAVNGEIISCDSMQIYKYMDIGSAKPTQEECAEVKHYLVDEIDPAQDFSVSDYQQLAAKYINVASDKGKIPVIEGGTGLYLNSLIYEMDFSNAGRDEELRNRLYAEAEEYGAEYIHSKLEELEPETAARIHPNNVKKVVRALEGALSGNTIKDFSDCNKKNPEYEFILIGLTRNRDELYERINLRVDKMVEEGLFEEVRTLMDKGLDEEDISMKGIGYKEIISYFNGEINMDEAIDLIKKNTRHLAKRQLTWFKRYDEMKWFNISDYVNEDALFNEITDYLKQEI